MNAAESRCPVSVTRIAKYQWSAVQGEKYAEGKSEADAVANLTRTLVLLR